MEAAQYSINTQLLTQMHRIAFVRRIPAASMTIKSIGHQENAWSRCHVEQLHMVMNVSIDQQLVFFMHDAERGHE